MVAFLFARELSLGPLLTARALLAGPDPAGVIRLLARATGEAARLAAVVCRTSAERRRPVDALRGRRILGLDAARGPPAAARAHRNGQRGGRRHDRWDLGNRACAAPTGSSPGP
ncbi:hypothetical protein [Streptomyces avicenniae]|uniref:hypothetical protein n=1 Tax=Streptomyces avicenniae TaxID=500153 RepID=UPI00167E711D|nr:hypothetical protein [Streptomyces avicenniae]